MPPIRVPALVLTLVLALSATPGFAATQDSRDDVLQATIAGEFALKAGKLDEAAAWYLQAADAASGDTGLAQRAAGVALVAGDEDRAAAALRLWREREGGIPLAMIAVTLGALSTILTALVPAMPTTRPPGVRGPIMAALLIYDGAWMAYLWRRRTRECRS